MTRAEGELDEYGKRVMAPLRPAPPINLKVMEDAKARFLMQGEHLRQGLIPKPAYTATDQANRVSDSMKKGIFSPLYKALVAILLVLVLVTASSFTVYAAQSSLPGDPLYTIKSASEDVRLSLTFSTKAKLDLTLDFTNRRLNEINTLVSEGEPLPAQTSDRYQHELEQALQIAAQMNNQQMQVALNQVKIQAEDQGMTIDELISRLPDRASPAIIHLQERLEEQVQLSTIGEKNPQQFRLEVQQREHNRRNVKRTPGTEELESTPVSTPGASMPSQPDNNHGGDMGQPTAAPGHGNPGNGNHGPNPTHTPRP